MSGFGSSSLFRTLRPRSSGGSRRYSGFGRRSARRCCDSLELEAHGSLAIYRESPGV